MNKKTVAILEGIGTIVLGVLIAVFGGLAVLDIYFGIIFLVAGAALLIFHFIEVAKTKLVEFASIFLGVTLILLGTFLLAHLLSFGIFVQFFIILLIAAGATLIVMGAFNMARISTFYGVGQMVIGLLAITFGVLYLTVPQFQVAFWIVVGVMVAVYGVLLTASALASKK